MVASPYFNFPGILEFLLQDDPSLITWNFPTFYYCQNREKNIINFFLIIIILPGYSKRKYKEQYS